MRRNVEVVVLSDIHLGHKYCHYNELLKYLKSIRPQKLILNGDFFDHWPRKNNKLKYEGVAIIQQIISMSMKGTDVYYIAGNHDDIVRRFVGTTFEKIKIRNNVIFMLDGKKHWFFHGDVLDSYKWITPFYKSLGKNSYFMLLRINRMNNKIRKFMGKHPYSLSKIVKSKINKAQLYAEKFRETAIKLAHEKNCDVVVTGHIHRPELYLQKVDDKEILYMNSGDWIENLCALEYSYQKWTLYQYDPLDFEIRNPKLNLKKRDLEHYDNIDSVLSL